MFGRYEWDMLTDVVWLMSIWASGCGQWSLWPLSNLSDHHGLQCPFFYNQCFLHIVCIIIYIYNIYICNSVIIFNRKNDRLPPFSVFLFVIRLVFPKDPRRPPSCATWCAADHLGIFDNKVELLSGPEVSISGAFCMVLWHGFFDKLWQIIHLHLPRGAKWFLNGVKSPSLRV